MAKLIGTKPDQVPTNADLGTMAYQDAESLKAGNLNVVSGQVAFDRLFRIEGNLGSDTNYTAPTFNSTDFHFFSCPQRTVTSGTSPDTFTLFNLPSSVASASGMVFVTAENSGVNVTWGYIHYFYMSNNSFTQTALATGSSQGTATFALSKSSAAIQATLTYAGGLGGNIRYSVGGFVHVFDY